MDLLSFMLWLFSDLAGGLMTFGRLHQKSSSTRSRPRRAKRSPVPPKNSKSCWTDFRTLEFAQAGAHVQRMADKKPRPGLRERVEMRRRGIDPDSVGKKKKNETLRLGGVTMQLFSVFGLLGYIVYYTQGETVELRVELLVILSGLFVTGRIMTWLGGSRSLRF